MKPTLMFLLSVGLALAVIVLPVDGAVDLCTPRQIHLSYGKLSTDVVVMWTTDTQCNSAVSYGFSPWSLDQKSSGQSQLFNGKYIHEVHLKDLLPDKTYIYSPSVGKGYTASKYFFKTLSGDESGEVSFLIVSDLNSSSPAIPFLIQEAEKGEYAAILHTGNIALNLSSTNGTKGDEYMMAIEPAVASVPYLVSPGPREMADNTVPYYLHRFSMPDSDWPMSMTKLWYSLDIGPVHLISFSTEVFYLKDYEYYSKLQHNWLLKDLEAASKNRKKVPWLIAFGNRPFYCTYDDPELVCNQKNSKIKSGLEDIFFHFGVDIIIQSYGGTYERTFPMLKNVATSFNYTNPNGPVYIVNGGSSHYDLEYNFTTPEWSAFSFSNESVVTIGCLRVINSSIVEYEQINVEDKTVIDSFRIEQEHHRQFSIQNLSSNIAAEVDKNIVDAGGKPGTLNIEEVKSTSTNSNKDDLLKEDNKMRIIIGSTCAGVALVLVVVIISAKKCKRKSKVTRRWEQMDINYGKKFYSKAPDKDEDNDFEIDMSDGTEPTRKLLNTAE